jgi:hypothetical protein
LPPYFSSIAAITGLKVHTIIGNYSVVSTMVLPMPSGSKSLMPSVKLLMAKESPEIIG